MRCDDFKDQVSGRKSFEGDPMGLLMMVVSAIYSIGLWGAVILKLFHVIAVSWGVILNWWILATLALAVIFALLSSGHAQRHWDGDDDGPG